MSNDLIGHNGGPDIETPKQSLRTQWAKALFADENTPAYVMAMAWAIHWYSKSDGTGAALSNQQLQTICGISEDTATKGKAWLRNNGYVQLKVGTGVQKTQFQMVLPQDGVRPQRTLHPPTAEGPLPEGPLPTDPPPPTADPGVRSQRVHIQERDSVNNQDLRASARTTKPVSGKSFWQSALNHSVNEGVELDESGLPRLLNGHRTKWLEEFGGDAKRLDLALSQIAGGIQPQNNRPLIIQVESKLADIVAKKRDQDTRYASAAKANRAPATKPKPSRW